MKEGWMKNVKDELWMMKDEGWWFQAVEGFWGQTDKRTDICDCRVAFATENFLDLKNKESKKSDIVTKGS